MAFQRTSTAPFCSLNLQKYEKLLPFCLRTKANKQTKRISYPLSSVTQPSVFFFRLCITENFYFFHLNSYISFFPSFFFSFTRAEIATRCGCNLSLLPWRRLGCEQACSRGSVVLPLDYAPGF